MTEVKIVSRFNGLKDRAVRLGLNIGYGADSFFIHDKDGRTLCVTPTVEGISCYIDAVENMTDDE